jgi:uncharacterized protein (DUF2336 family)
MIVRRFLLWARMASVAERADGASALARAYLYSQLSAEDRSDADAALTALLDDPSPLVRRALADALGSALDAPRHIVVALANDQSDVSSIVLARSPVISDADLIDCAATGDDLAQTAIAIRPGLSAGVSAALAEVGASDAMIALADNHSATIPDFSFLRMIERHGDDGRLREALAMRRDLPIGARQALAVAVAQTLSRFAVGCGWLSHERSERVTREAKERATISLTAHDIEEAQDLVDHLRSSAQLTPALILRALLSGATTFVEAAFADLSDMPLSRVAGLLADPRGAGFAAVYRKTSLPAPLAPAFRAAFEALHRRGFAADQHDQPRLSRAVVEHVITACDKLPVEEAGRLVAMLRRFESEAAREDARVRADRMADQAALETLLEIDPEGLLLHDEAVNDDEPLEPGYDDEDTSDLEAAFAAEADERRGERLMVA